MITLATGREAEQHKVNYKINVVCLHGLKDKIFGSSAVT